MKTMAALFFCAAGLLAQDGTTTAPKLSDAELGQLGGYVAEQVDAVADPAALEKSILEKIEEIRKGKKDEPPAPKKGKKKRKKDAASKASASGDTIKNGLTEADRLALAKFVVSEITAGHQGEAFASAVKKELGSSMASA